MWSDVKRLYEGRSGRILTTVVVLLILYSAMLNFLRGPMTISKIFGSVGVLAIFGAVLFATLWPNGKSKIARIGEKYGLHISAVFALYFLGWAISLWTTDSGDSLFFYLVLSGCLMLFIDLFRRLLPTTDVSSTQ